MKKRVIGLFLLIGLPLVAIADNIHVTVNSPVYSYPDNREFKESVYVCVLTPFNKMYAGVDVKKTQAQSNASQSCQNKEGSNSIFCTPKDAMCTTATVILSNGDSRHQGVSAIVLFNGFDQTGQHLLVNESIDDFSTYNFDNKIMSFDIPDGWTVRFFKEKNFQGDYYTRSSGKGNADDFPHSISSMKILRKK